MKLVRHRKSSSVSRRKLRNRRNKSGSRKKYTHTHTHTHTIKGGCWGKKGGARSRRYGHKRTHKRGKRFHRGGETPMEEILGSIISMEKSQAGNGPYMLNRTGNPEFSPTIALKYKKQGELFPETKEFYLNVIYDKNNTNGEFTITLHRLPASSDDPYFEYKGNLLSPVSAALIVNDRPKQESKNIKNRVYNFNYHENNDKLDKIMESFNQFTASIRQVPSSTNSADDYRDG